MYIYTQTPPLSQNDTRLYNTVISRPILLDGEAALHSITKVAAASSSAVQLAVVAAALLLGGGAALGGIIIPFIPAPPGIIMPLVPAAPGAIIIPLLLAPPGICPGIKGLAAAALPPDGDPPSLIGELALMLPAGVWVCGRRGNEQQGCSQQRAAGWCETVPKTKIGVLFSSPEEPVLCLEQKMHTPT